MKSLMQKLRGVSRSCAWSSLPEPTRFGRHPANHLCDELVPVNYVCDWFVTRCTIKAQAAQANN
ncbi:MAG: hypothetical protein ACKOQM_06440, partial [Novosphingobium sp.]